MNTVD